MANLTKIDLSRLWYKNRIILAMRLLLLRYSLVVSPESIADQINKINYQEGKLSRGSQTTSE